jgi:hypothetical protein
MEYREGVEIKLQALRADGSESLTSLSNRFSPASVGKSEPQSLELMAKRKNLHHDRNLTAVTRQVSIPSLIEISRFISCPRVVHKLGISEAAVTPQTKKKFE